MTSSDCTARKFRIADKLFNIFVKKSRPNNKCLFESLTVQNADRSTTEQEVLEFRTKKLKHIADNFDQYEELLATAVTSDILSNEKMKEKMEDEMDEMDDEKKTAFMKVKCSEHLKKMQNNENEWGGAESIAAFSDVSETNVLLFSNSNGLDLVQYNEKYSKIAFILYSGLNHYDGLLWMLLLKF